MVVQKCWYRRRKIAIAVTELEWKVVLLIRATSRDQSPTLHIKLSIANSTGPSPTVHLQQSISNVPSPTAHVHPQRSISNGPFPMPHHTVSYPHPRPHYTGRNLDFLFLSLKSFLSLIFTSSPLLLLLHFHALSLLHLTPPPLPT